LAIDGAGLAVRVGFTFVRVEHLNFVESHYKNAAVAAILVFPLGRIRFGKLDMELAIAEGIFSVYTRRFGDNFKIAVLDFPFLRGFRLFEPTWKGLCRRKGSPHRKELFPALPACLQCPM